MVAGEGRLVSRVVAVLSCYLVSSVDMVL